MTTIAVSLATAQNDGSSTQKALLVQKMPLQQVLEHPDAFMSSVEKACKSLLPTSAGLRITYVDEEEDTCTLTQDTVKDAMSCARRDGEVYSLKLTASAQASAAAAHAGAEAFLAMLPRAAWAEDPTVLPNEEDLRPLATPPMTMAPSLCGKAWPDALPTARAGRSSVRKLPNDLVELMQAKFTKGKGHLLGQLEGTAPASDPEPSPTSQTTGLAEISEVCAQFARKDEDHLVLKREVEELKLQVSMYQEEAQRSLKLAEAHQRDELAAREAAEEMRKTAATASTDAKRAALAERALEAKATECDRVRQELVQTIAEVMEATESALLADRLRHQAAAALEKAQSELQEEKQHVSELENTVENLRGEVDAVRTQVAQRDMAIENQERMLMTLHEHCEAKDGRVSSLEAELDKVNALARRIAAQAAAEQNAAQEAAAEQAEAETKAKELEAHAVVDAMQPLVMGIEASEAPCRDASDEFAELIEAHGAHAVHHLGGVKLGAGSSPAAVPVCATFSVTNDGKVPWPITTALVLVEGEACGLSLQSAPSAACGESVEIVMELLVRPSVEPDTRRSVWSITDAATGKPLGPLLVFEVFWE